MHIVGPKSVPTPMGNKPYYVYTLAYPADFVLEDGTDLSNVVFYVGKGTVQPRGIQRVDTHEGDARSTVQDRYLFNKRKIAAIQSVWRRGQHIQKRVVAEFDADIEALKHELDCIQQYAGPHLTNRMDNPYHGPEARQYEPERKERTINLLTAPLTQLLDMGFLGAELSDLARLREDLKNDCVGDPQSYPNMIGLFLAMS